MTRHGRKYGAIAFIMRLRSVSGALDGVLAEAKVAFNEGN